MLNENGFLELGDYRLQVPEGNGYRLDVESAKVIDHLDKKLIALTGSEGDFCLGFAYGSTFRDHQIARYIENQIEIYNDDFINTGSEISQGRVVALNSLLKEIKKGH